jgi:hypothetical protein
VRTFLLTFSILLSASLPCLAQEGFVFTMPGGLSGGYENRMPFDGKFINDYFMDFTTPAASYLRQTARTSFAASYQAEFEMFTTHKELNSWNHAAGLRLTHDLSRRTSFEFGDSFIATEDPARWLTGGFFLLPRSKFRQNMGYAGLAYRMTPRTMVNVRLSSSYVSARTPNATGPNFFDNRSFSPSVSISRDLSRRHKISAVYGYLRVDPSGPPITAGIPLTRNAQTMSATYTYSQGTDFILSVGAGALRINGNNYSISAHMERRLGLVRIRADYGRQLTVFTVFGPNSNPGDLIPGFANALLPSAIVDAGSLALVARFSRRFGAEVRGSYASNSSALTTKDIRTFISGTRLDYMIHERVYAFAAFEIYRQNLTFPLGVQVNRNRYFAGIEFLLTRRPLPAETSALPTVDRQGNSLLYDDTMTIRPTARKRN